MDFTVVRLVLLMPVALAMGQPAQTGGPGRKPWDIVLEASSVREYARFVTEGGMKSAHLRERDLSLFIEHYW